MLTPQLSDLTPNRVDALYNIDGAQPSAEPMFLFLVGAPGSGKSSGHARAFDAGILQPGDYATINLDTLLESLIPFRAASSMAQYLKRNPKTRDLVHFGSIGAYGTRKENLGLFKWYDEAHDALEEADPVTIQQFNRVRAQFAPLKDQESRERLLDINEAALQRAIDKRINIVYETTLSLTKEGRVNKVDAIMKQLKKRPYRVVFYHVTGSPEDVAQRIRARQDHGTPQEPYPFYRYVSLKHVAESVRDTKEAFDAVHKQYKKVAIFDEFVNTMVPMRLPAENRRSSSTRRRRIVSAYGPNKSLNASYRVSSSSSLFRLSSSSSERRRRTTRKSQSKSSDPI
jgi:predicted ABC-type ATPase